MSDPQARLLELDLEYTNRTIDKFDNIRFTIKGWTVTTCSALLALGIGSKNAAIALSGVFAVAFFGYLEILYMDMQVRTMRRNNELAGRLQRSVASPSESMNGYTFGLGATFPRGVKFQFADVPSILKSRPEMYVFYIGLALALGGASGLLWLLQ